MTTKDKIITALALCFLTSAYFVYKNNNNQNEFQEKMKLIENYDKTNKRLFNLVDEYRKDTLKLSK